MRVPRSQRGRVRLMIVAAVAAAALLGMLMLSASSLSRRLDADLARARAEGARVAQVTKRSAELARMEGQARARIAAQAGEGALPAPCPDPGPLPEDVPSPTRPTALFPWDPGLQDRRRELDARTASIQRGLNLERRLPEQERCLEELQARLAALPPAPAPPAP